MENDFIPEKLWTKAEMILQGLRINKFLKKMDNGNLKQEQPTFPVQGQRPTIEEEMSTPPAPMTDDDIPF